IRQVFGNSRRYVYFPRTSETVKGPSLFGASFFDSYGPLIFFISNQTNSPWISFFGSFVLLCSMTCLASSCAANTSCLCYSRRIHNVIQGTTKEFKFEDGSYDERTSQMALLPPD